jgi:hypothetical protein
MAASSFSILEAPTSMTKVHKICLAAFILAASIAQYAVKGEKGTGQKEKKGQVR